MNDVPMGKPTGVCAGAMPPTHDAQLVVAQALCVGFYGRAVMPPVTWTVARGEVWALVGDNGTGKTTLLRSLLRLLPSCGGSLAYAPKLVIAYMAQRTRPSAAVPMRVRDFVCGGAERSWSFLRPCRSTACRDDLERFARRLDFVELLERPFASLSEGQKQRVCLGRALLSRPDLLVLDEPTSAMDMVAEADLLASLRQLAAQYAMGIIVVGHHLPALFASTSHWAWLQKSPAGMVCGTCTEMRAHAGFAAHYARLLDAGVPSEL